MEDNAMKKFLYIMMVALCLLLTAFAACAEGEPMEVDVTFDGYQESGGMLYVTWTEEAYETGGLGLSGVPGQKIGEVLKQSGVLSVEPVKEGDTFEGWMEAEVMITVDEEGFEWAEYSLIPDYLYTTEELLNLPVPEKSVMYVAKWAGIPAESYYAPYAEETIVIPSITLLSGDGVMQIDSEGEQYESSSIIVTVDPGQTFGEALSLEEITDVTLDGKTFTGWTVYDVAAMEAGETPVEEEGVLCYEVFKGWYMILREYTICQELISTQELAELICETTDHVVVANFK